LKRETWVPFAAALSGLVAVIVGAFGAHAIQDEAAKAWIDTGVKFHLAHTMAMLACVSMRGWGAPGAMRAPPVFLLGIFLFSGSLYALAMGAPKGIAMLAPIGGLSFMIGWGLFAISGWKYWRGAKDRA
jgi:uncharacterized membrane protein YgdD (TMEM256/DUF423 family)